MPIIRIVDASLDEMDVPDVQLIVALCVGELRPLPEPLASIDWRLCGRLWKAFRQTDFDESRSSPLLVASEGRFRCPATLCIRVPEDGGPVAAREAARVGAQHAVALEAALCLWTFPGGTHLAEMAETLFDVWEADPVAEEVRWMVPRAEQRSVREKLELRRRRRRLGQTGPSDAP